MKYKTKWFGMVYVDLTHKKKTTKNHISSNFSFIIDISRRFSTSGTRGCLGCTGNLAHVLDDLLSGGDDAFTDLMQRV